MGYNALMFPDFQIGDLVRMRKAHPCGGFEWKIFRLGADIGLECQTCQRRVLLSRRELAHKMKKLQPSLPTSENNPDRA
jgi:hypothetical protein